MSEINRKGLIVLAATGVFLGITEPFWGSLIDKWFEIEIANKIYLTVILAILTGVTWETKNLIDQGEKIDQDSFNIFQQLSEIKEQGNASKLEEFSTSEDFYKALQANVKNAKSHLLLTHFRHHAPQSIQGGDEFFDWVNRLAKDNNNCSVYRMGAPLSDEMRKWCKSQIEESKTTDNYNFQEVDLRVPQMSFAVIDKKTVFISIPGRSLGDTRAYKIEDEDIANWYASYFNFLWADYAGKTSS